MLKTIPTARPATEVRDEEQNGKGILVDRGEKEPVQKSRKGQLKSQKRLSPKNRSKRKN